MTHALIRLAAVVGSLAALVAATACSASAPSAAGRSGPISQGLPWFAFLDRFKVVSQIASTVPANGDVNPYGVAVVPHSVGRLVGGEFLVSNFNGKANVQGTGTTVVQVAPDGTQHQFARVSALPRSMSCPGGIGLTTALAVLPGGWVIVGSLPTASGALPAANPLGCLIVLDSHGKPAATWTSPKINGPWDMTVQATAGHASLFVSNVLNRPAGDGAPAAAGLCTVVRITVNLPAGGRPQLAGITTIGTGFPWKQDKTALIQGPTGLALSPAGTLYVASTLDNSISAIPDAVARSTPAIGGSAIVYSGRGLSGPLGLTWAPNGDLIAMNGNNGNAVEITPTGRHVATKTLVPGGAGDLFGVTPVGDGNGLLFVNDGTNALDLLSG